MDIRSEKSTVRFDCHEAQQSACCMVYHREILQACKR